MYGANNPIKIDEDPSIKIPNINFADDINPELSFCEVLCEARRCYYICDNMSDLFRHRI
jgi:hypothetical protein